MMYVIPKKGTFAQGFYPETEEEAAILAAREERQRKAKEEAQAYRDKLLTEREERIEAERKAKYEAGLQPVVALARFLVDRIEHTELRRTIASLATTDRQKLTDVMLEIFNVDDDDLKHGRRVPAKVRHGA